MALRARREPETTVLLRLVQAEWNTFVQRVEAGERVVPRFWLREVEGYLRCGILGYGLRACPATSGRLAQDCRGQQTQHP